MHNTPLLKALGEQDKSMPFRPEGVQAHSHGWSRVAAGGCPPAAPTDPDVRD